ncbi:MAG: helix-turn-helix domain-containing protein [Oscillospiraceae bacterium]
MEWADKLAENLEIYYEATGVTVSLLSEDGEAAETFGTECSYCSLFKEASGSYCPCHVAHLNACKEAARLQEGYVFSCPAGCVNFAVPVFINGNLRANILAGPIMLDYPDLDLIDGIIQKYNIDLKYRSKLYGAYSGAPLVDPHRARYLCKLLVELTSNVLPTADNVFRQRQIEQNVQQARIGEYIQVIKRNDEDISSSQFELEKQLISDVLVGNKEHAKATLNKILGQIYFVSSNNFEIIRVRTIELIAILSRAIVENGGDTNDAYRMADDALHSIISAKDLTDLSYTLLEILDVFIELTFSQQSSPESPTIQKAVRYIHENYYEPLSLESVARHVGLNPTYFSAAFKRQMSKGFLTYLTEYRISQAQLLLKNSSMSIIDIAIAVGFENQSYFSKKFKSVVGMSPRQYRKST